MADNGMLQYRTKSELVERQLRQRILAGELAPGSVLNQVDLAAELGVSTTPLREALNHLRAEGLVFVDGSRDTRVAELDPDEAVHIYELRQALDPLAARLAALRRDDEDVVRLQRAAGALFAAYDRSLEETIDPHLEFHRALHLATHNDMLISALDVIWARSDRYRRFGGSVVEPKPARARQAEHRRLLEAVLAQEPDAAEREMRQHVELSVTSAAATVLVDAGEVPARRAR